MERPHAGLVGDDDRVPTPAGFVLIRTARTTIARDAGRNAQERGSSSDCSTSRMPILARR